MWIISETTLLFHINVKAYSKICVYTFTGLQNYTTFNGATCEPYLIRACVWIEMGLVQFQYVIVQVFCAIRENIRTSFVEPKCTFGETINKP